MLETSRRAVKIVNAQTEPFRWQDGHGIDSPNAMRYSARVAS